MTQSTTDPARDGAAPAEPAAPALAAALAELTAIADDAALVIARSDPAAAAATGLVPREERPALPDVGPAALAARADAERALLARARAVVLPAGAVAPQPGESEDARRARVLRDHLVDRLETDVEFIDSGEAGAHLGNLTSPFQRLTRWAHAGAPEPGDAEAWERTAARLEALPEALAGLAASVDASAAKGVTAPRSQVLLVARQAHGLAQRAGEVSGTGAAGNVAGSDSALAAPALEDGPVAALAAASSCALRPRLEGAASAAIDALGSLADHLETDIAPQASPREGVGPERHAQWVRRLLGTRLDPAQLSEWALAELDAVVAAQDAIAREALPADELAALGAEPAPGAPAAAYDAFLRSDPSLGFPPEGFPDWGEGVVAEAWDALVGTVVPIPEQLGRPVVGIDPPGGGVHYEEPDPDTGRPGQVLRSFAEGDEVVWPWIERTTVLHESVPGHHAHSGAQSVDPRLTLWQRHLAKVPGCNEGWGLYAEALGARHGLLAEPADRFGWLAARRWRLARLLIDLGIHAWLPVPDAVAALPGASGSAEWDRPTAEAVLRAHTVLGEGFLLFEVDKQLGWPAQGLSYVVGEQVWLAGREAAERAAAAEGREFDELAFHTRGIGLGSVGLGLLARELG